MYFYCFTIILLMLFVFCLLCWGEKGFIWLHFHIPVHHLRKSGQGRICLLACFLPYRVQNQPPKDGLTHSGLSPPPLITSQENALQLGLTCGGIFSVEVLPMGLQFSSAPSVFFLTLSLGSPGSVHDE